jgi:hypothetical protein
LVSFYLFPDPLEAKELMKSVALKDAAGRKGGEQGWCKGTSRMLPFAAAKMIVQKLKLQGVKEWKAWSKAGKRPSNIPSSPHDRTQRGERGGGVTSSSWSEKAACRGV